MGTHVILAPGARKWGSDLRFMTSFRVDHADRLDHLDHLDRLDHVLSSRIAHFICVLSVDTDLDPP